MAQHGLPAPRQGRPDPVGVLAALAVAVHLVGLYRPQGPPTPGWFPQADKLEHLVGFAAPVCLLLLALGRAARRAGKAPSDRAWLVVPAVFAAHAVVSELIQGAFYRGRTGDVVDVLADWCGVGLGYLAARLLARRGTRARSTTGAVLRTR